ncbi:heavy metal-associated domain-containing protein [Nocardia sp. NBC_00881]
MSTSIVTVAAMTCDGCASKVRTALGAVAGIHRCRR